MRNKMKKNAHKTDQKTPLKHKPTRVNRNTAEAELEENSQPYDEIGKTDEEIRREDQEESKEHRVNPGPVPTEGS